jgi:thioredoxin 2
MAAPLEVDESAFDDIIQNARVPVFVDFWAAWCGPCRVAAPEVEALARELSGKAVVLKVDTEQNQGLAARYKIQSIPYFMVFQKARPTFQRAGLAPRAEMRRWVEQQMAA